VIVVTVDTKANSAGILGEVNGENNGWILNGANHRTEDICWNDDAFLRRCSELENKQQRGKSCLRQNRSTTAFATSSVVGSLHLGPW